MHRLLEDSQGTLTEANGYLKLPWVEVPRSGSQEPGASDCRWLVWGEAVCWASAQQLR